MGFFSSCNHENTSLETETKSQFNFMGVNQCLERINEVCDDCGKLFLKVLGVAPLMITQIQLQLDMEFLNGEIF